MLTVNINLISIGYTPSWPVRDPHRFTSFRQSFIFFVDGGLIMDGPLRMDCGSYRSRFLIQLLRVLVFDRKIEFRNLETFLLVVWVK